MTTSVIEHETTDELALSGHLVLHVHDFDHVQIKGSIVSLDSLHGVDDDFSERVGEVRVDLCGKRGSGNFQK